MNMIQFMRFSPDVRWMVMSPYWLAKGSHDTFRFNTGECPELNTLGQSLLDLYDMNVPPRILGTWLEEFRFIN